MLLDILLAGGYYILPILVGILTAAVIYTRWHYGTLESVPGLKAIVKPAFVGGSVVNIHKKVVHENDDKLVKKYGKVYGCYEGREPQVFIADPDIIKHIFVKDFDHFHNKRMLDFGDELMNEMIDILPYEKWKPIRNFITPILSTGKIRAMSTAISEAIQEWMATVKLEVERTNGIFEPKRMFTALTTDVIARCGFGTRLNSLHDPNNIFIQNIKKVVHEDKSKNFMVPLILSFPFLTKVMPIIPHDGLQFFADVLQDVMNSRRATNTRVNDFVNTLNEMMDKVDTDPEWKSLGIKRNTVISQALVFFLAGFKTTSTALTFLTYLLSTHPDIQNKLLEEVDSYLKRHGGKISHETIGELEYMSACMHETLRLFPPVNRLERVCNKEWVHQESGLRIPKGMVVQVPQWSVHRSEDVYEDALKFKPERFLPANKEKLNQYAFLPFGLGPHNCVGIKFAKEEILLAMTNVLKDFRFVPNETTRLKFLKGNLFFTMAIETFSVTAVKRN